MSTQEVLIELESAPRCLFRDSNDRLKTFVYGRKKKKKKKKKKLKSKFSFMSWEVDEALV